jgi:mono/diheme cytochrome c family protein
MNPRTGKTTAPAQGRRHALMRVIAASTAPSIVLAMAMGLAAAGTCAAAYLDAGESPQHFVQRDGESIYRAICQGCHMPNGQGAQGAGHYPALAQNPRVAATPYILHNVVHGRNGMPAFGPALDDTQIAAVVNYVRTHFGNRIDDKVTAEEVKAERANSD